MEKRLADGRLVAFLARLVLFSDSKKLVRMLKVYLKTKSHGLLINWRDVEEIRQEHIDETSLGQAAFFLSLAL